MKNNVAILEENSLLNQKINSHQIKKIYIPFSYISFLFISILLISNLYYTSKLVNYQKKYTQFLKNENISHKIVYKYNSEEKNKQKYQEGNKEIRYKFLNLSNASIETTDLNVLKKPLFK